ncbi:Hypothetical protein R9X50_00493500 [Acrodontium crateriforme]|uniref:Dipeptidyl-peptidase V n=1 Tax=Acrodontium crateriforme TaxID=150365 RepID=A0AAQ3M681_9PEZI|nr:Hypothetical protein R9X50_00493500 [Acrodontium crateriforme]
MASSEITIESLLSLQIPSDLSLSPSGKQVLYSTTVGVFPHQNANGQTISRLWLAETHTKHSARAITNGKWNDVLPCWRPDGKAVAFVSDRGELGKTNAVYLLALEKNEGEASVEALTDETREKGITSLAWSPDGKSLAFLVADEKTEERKKRDEEKDDVVVYGAEWEYARLRILNVTTMEVHTPITRNAHVVAFAWSPNGSHIAFAEVASPDIEESFISGTTFSVIEIGSDGKAGNVEGICSFPNDIHPKTSLKWTGSQLLFVGPVAAGESSVSANRFYSISMDGEASTRSYQPHSAGENDCAWSIQTPNSVDAVVEVQSGVETHLRMLEGGRKLLSVKQQILSWSAALAENGSDEVTLAIAVGDPNSPTEVYTTTSSKGELIAVSNHGAAFTDIKFGECTFLSCPSTDNEVELDSLFITPSTAKPHTPLPTIVLIHGGPYWRAALSFEVYHFMWGPLLLSKGYGILLPNYRGRSGRGEKFAAYGKKSGGKDYEDVVATTNNAVEKGVADPDRLLVAGWSQGGFLSFLAAVRNGTHAFPWRFRAAIPGAGVSCQDTMCLTSDIGAVESQLCNGAPWDRAETCPARIGSAIAGLRLRKNLALIPPMLILHGEKDERVPLEQAVGMRRAMRAAGLRDKVEMVTYPREPHTIHEWKHLVDLGKRMVAFVEKHIGSGSV